jgi:protein-S-isoprenylcysteine O-methyltransferase Ste14
MLSAFVVFPRVRSDYRAKGKLSTPTALLQSGYFCAYALSSYLFLDSLLSRLRIRSPLFAAALVLMLMGLLAVLLSMPKLGQRSFGRQIGRLHTSGIYRHSRNPQLVGGLLLVVGYAMLWPSWTGALWASLWLPIAHLMVRGEEEHLTRTFGEEYLEYCWRTPRYIGLPKQ